MVGKDHTGRLWFGTMHDDCQTVGGALYSWEEGTSPRIHDTGYIATNGPVVSPDGYNLYHTDSASRTVYRFDLSIDGKLLSKQSFIHFDDDVYPDGMVVDQDGNLWIALFNGWRVERYSPQAQKIDEIRFPWANVTKPAFGGGDLRTLYVTTAWTGLTAAAHEKQPLAGALFSFHVQIPGLLPTEVAYSSRATTL